MNDWQKDKFDKYETQLKDELAEYENYERALSLIEYNPKKDGTARQNFADNFAIRGLGTSDKYPSGHTYRRVTVSPVIHNVYNGGSTVSCLDITVLAIDTPDDMAKAGIDRKVKYVNDARFAFSIFGDGPDMTPDSTAEQYVEAIHKQIIPGIKRRQEQLKKEIELLPAVFHQFVIMANMYKALDKQTKDTCTLKYIITHLVKDIPVLHD